MSTISKPKIIDKSIVNFVIKTLPKISGDPDYESLNYIIQELYVNAATLTKNIAGGKHVCIVVIMNYTLYTTLAMVTS